MVTGTCLGVLVDETVQELYGCEVLQRITGIDYSFSLQGRGREGRKEKGIRRERGD
jgi:hypothetical protein